MINSSFNRINSTSNCLSNVISQFFRQLNTKTNLLNPCINSTTQKRNASHFKFVPDVAPASLGETTKMNLCQAVTNALDISLSADKTAGKLDYNHIEEKNHLKN
jgi:hypothetical protein